MSDVMFFGVLGMPYEMAMESELSRRQFHARVQDAIQRVKDAEQRAEDAERERDELRKDAERYRWLRDRNDWSHEPQICEADGAAWCVTVYTPVSVVDPTDDENLDRGIDAAMAQEGGK